MSNIQALQDFINKAERNRKYPPNTAQGYRVAIKLFESELNEDEKESLDRFEANLGQIYRDVANRNNTVSAGSLATYKSRVIKVIADYKKYGVDSTKMAGWNPTPIVRAKRNQKPDDSASETGDNNSPSSLKIPNSATSNMNRLELSLRPDAKCLIIVPHDLTKAESERIKKALDFLLPDSN